VRVATPARVAFGRDQHMLAQSGEMVATDRTTIGRRLAVGRRANRPPWRRRKLGHELILPPLAASLLLVASVAVGVGVARARSQRAARRPRGGRLGLRAGERPLAGLQRTALAELDVAIELLCGDWGDPADAVHETRKGLKRLRALMRLLRRELGEMGYAREDRVLRTVGRRLAGARDAEVLGTTLDRLLEGDASKLAGSSAVAALRDELAAERGRGRVDLATRVELAGELAALRARVRDWSLADHDDRATVRAGLRAIYGQGRRRWRRATRKRADERALHLWRKRVKDLRYAAEMLERPPARGAGAGRRLAQGARRERPGAPKREHAKRMHRVATRADRLGELLGAEHDHAQLAQRVVGASDAFASAPAAREALLAMIARRRRRLRAAALREGERLYRRSPRKFVRRLRRAY
jgi:CHAD domain